jgi:hypothetical protein
VGSGVIPFRSLPLRGMNNLRPSSARPQGNALPVLDHKETEATLAALRLRRAEIEAWLDGPAKKATLSALNRVIAELEREQEASVA